MFSDLDEKMMRHALEEAENAAAREEAPIGAVLVDAKGNVIASAGNAPIGDCDPTAHAEVKVLREAARKLGNYRLHGTTLYVTLEPCAMCAGAISHGRIERLVVGADDPKGGAVWHGAQYFDQPTCHWKPEVSKGLFAQEAGDLLRTFFRERRKK